MKQTFCLFCKEPIREKRLGTDFCCDSHRAKYWRKKNPKAKEKSKTRQETIVQAQATPNNVSSGVELASTLRGVIVQDIDPHLPEIDPLTHEKSQSQTQGGEPTLDELIALAKLKCDELDRQNKKVADQIANCDSQLKMLNREIPKGGIPRILPMPQQGKNMSRTGIEMKRFHLKHQQGVLFNDWSREFFQLHDLEQRKKSQPQMQNEKPPQQEIKPQEKIVETKKQEEIINVPITSSFGDVITSRELSEKTFIVLGFKLKWRDFIGTPSPAFLAAIYGRPGSGKSSYSCLWAVYLATNHGRVAYITAEEGIVLSLQEKFKITSGNAQIPNLFFGAQKSLAEIKKGIPQNIYHFLVLDSLTTLRIDAQGLRELRGHYRNCAIIAILQSTKAGFAKGSQEIIHDCDIEICVADGIATTKKNRFKQSGKTFRIFNDDDDDGAAGKNEKPLEPPRDVV